MQIIPRDGFNPYGALVRREVKLEGKQRHFWRVGGRTKDSVTWEHKGHAVAAPQPLSLGSIFMQR
jgi:hypothetical protein